MKVLGITGGVATGKSTVSKILKRYGGCLISADEIAHKIILPGNIAYKKIIKQFGKEVLSKHLTIDRKKLGERIFKNRKLRKILERITHPEIIARIKKEIKRTKNSKKYKFIILEAPLLFEAKISNLVDLIIVVVCSQKTQINRLMKKGLSRKLAKNMISAQIPLSKKIKKADIVIINRDLNVSRHYFKS
ncbi:MAG: dephospho-CoA kinase [Candidatus Firestonebacteria bacterium]